MLNKLAKPKKQKPINIKRFRKLAKEVKQIFDEEDKRLEQELLKEMIRND